MKANLDVLFKKHGYSDYKWIDPDQIVVAHWVRMKCMYGCDDYGRNASCPPNVPLVAECREFVKEYSTAVLFHFDKQVKKPEDRVGWSRKTNTKLCKLEREVFLSGFPKTFLLGMNCCRRCKKCVPTRSECKHPELVRPAAEAMAIDVFSTARQYGYPIEVLTDYGDTMNRYAILLIE